MKKLIASLILLPAVYATANAGEIGPGVNLVDGIYTIDVPKGTVAIQPITGNVFRVTTAPKGASEIFPESRVAAVKPFEIGVGQELKNNLFVVSSQSTTITVDLANGKVCFYDSKGNGLLEEVDGVDNTSAVKRVSFRGSDKEALYGGGERGHRLNLNQFGDTITMYNRQNYGYTEGDTRISQMGISVPYFVSDAGYAVLFDDYNKASVTLGDTITYSSATPRPLSYYFINGGGTISGVTEAFTGLVGRQDLPPFWALGYITSKYGYHNQQEALGAIDSLKTRGYPVDGIVLDLYWYGQETDMGRLAWDPVQWPNHKQMLADLKAQGVNTVIITQPYINKIGAIDNYNMLSAEGMLVKDSLGNTHDVTTWVGEAGMFDVSNPVTQEWLWNRLRPLTEEGVAGWWGDLGEPEVHPATIMHANGESAEEFHNYYGNMWSKIIYDGLRKDFPDMRPLLMMRGGTTGLQNYSVFPWTTDVSRSWGGFQPQVKLMLSSGLSGLAYMSSDLGGFAVDPENPIDEELYVRWVQMGAFTPSMRTHAQLRPEPYHYPESEEILKEYVQMRYKWLPYNYTLAYENATKGWPLARPLNFNGENKDEAYKDLSDEYLWGSEVLVAPVMTQGALSREVLFPSGKWYNWYDASKQYNGGTLEKITVEAPLAQLPLFIKEGAFIPQYELPIENVTQYDPTFLTIRYYPSDNESSYTLYDDNRMSPTSLEEGAFQLIDFIARHFGEELAITLRTNGGSYEGMPESRMLTFEIMDVNDPKEVTLSDGTMMERFMSPKMIRQYGYCYDEESRTLTVRLAWGYNPLTISVK